MYTVRMHRMKIKCAQVLCKKKATLIIGHCKYCDLDFCVAHRIPETHACSGIELCKMIDANRNTAQLLACKCVASKI